jgi:hypothetical protein
VSLAGVLWFFVYGHSDALDGPEGIGGVFVMVCVSGVFLLMCGLALILALKTRPASRLDAPAKVLSIIGMVVYGVPGGLGILMILWMIYAGITSLGTQ